MFPALKVIAAGIIVALVGGFLLSSITHPPEEASVLPAATSSPTGISELASTGLEPVLPQSWIEALFLDGQGDVWAVGNGLMRFSRQDGTYVSAGEWSVADGAPTLYASTPLAAARDGGLWIGEPAVGRFDGTRFAEVLADTDEAAVDFLEAADGTRWAAGQGKVWRWDGSAWTDVRAPETIFEDPAYVAALGDDGQGGIWVVTSHPDQWNVVGIAHYDGASWRTWGPGDQPTLAGHEYRDFAAGPSGQAYLATRGPLLAFDGTAWQELADVPAGEIMRMALAPDGTLWLAAPGKVTSRSPAGDVETIVLPAEEYPSISDIVALLDGAMVATDRSLYEIDEGTATTIWTPGSGPRVDRFWSGGSATGWLVADGDEVWISDEAGVWRCPVPMTVDGCQLLDQGLPPLPAGERVYIAEAPDGTLWATGPGWSEGPGGTAYLDDERWVLIDETPGQALTVGPDGTVWVMDTPGSELSAWRRDGSEWSAEHHPVPGSLSIEPLGRVHWMEVTPDGSVWILDGGWFPVLARFDDGSWTAELAQGDSVDGRPVEWLTAAVVDAEGHVWVLGSEPYEELEDMVSWVARVDGSTWTAFDAPIWLPEGLVAGEDGSVWLGGGGGGPLRFTGGTWTTPPEVADLPIAPVQVDADGTLWALGTWGGLYRLAAEG